MPISAWDLLEAKYRALNSAAGRGEIGPAVDRPGWEAASDWFNDPRRGASTLFGGFGDYLRDTSQGVRTDYPGLLSASLDMIPGVDDVLAKGTAAALPAIGATWLGRRMMAQPAAKAAGPRGEQPYGMSQDLLESDWLARQAGFQNEAPGELFAQARRNRISTQAAARAKELAAELRGGKPGAAEKIDAEFGGMPQFQNAYNAAVAEEAQGGLLGNVFPGQRGALGDRKYKYGIPRESITVMNPQRAAYPEIYDNPADVAARAAANVAEENPAMSGLFGVTRDDLYEMHRGAVGNRPPNLPGMAKKTRGAAVARNVMNPKNTQRIVDVLSEAERYPNLVKGMDAWYEMRPLYERMQQISDDPVSDFLRFQAMTGMASPNADVLNELNRGTGALYLANQGRFEDFMKYGGLPADVKRKIAPQDMLGIAGHTTHSTAQAKPMSMYLGSGEMKLKSPKVPLYVQSAGVPETGFQTQWPVGDAHWSRGVGLADVRPMKKVKGKMAVPGGSYSMPELASLGPWWADKVAGPLGINSVDAQARMWGTFAPATGVTTKVGAPKLELISQKIMDAAQAYGIPPEQARDLLLTGKIYAPNLGLLGNVQLPIR